MLKSSDNSLSIKPATPENTDGLPVTDSPSAAAVVGSADDKLVDASVSALPQPVAADLENGAGVTVPPASLVPVATVGDVVVPQQTDARGNVNAPDDHSKVIPGISPATVFAMPAIGSDETVKLATQITHTSEANALNSNEAAAKVSAGQASQPTLASAASSYDGPLKAHQEELAKARQDQQLNVDKEKAEQAKVAAVQGAPK